MTEIINLVCGDISDDGHGLTQSTIIQTNLNVNDIKVSYMKGVEIVGFNLKHHVARAYEDDFLPQEYVEKLKSSGIDIEFENVLINDSDGIHINPDEYTLIYLNICKLGNPDFIYTIIKNIEVDIGGYGLFWGD